MGFLQTAHPLRFLNRDRPNEFEHPARLPSNHHYKLFTRLSADGW